MTHFNSIFNDKKTTFQFKIKFIKTHEILFINNALNEFNVIVRDIIKSMFDNYIKRIVVEFKKQSVYVVETCVVVIFKYKLMNSSKSFKSLFRVTYVEAGKIQVEKLAQTPQPNNRENFENIKNTIPMGFTKSNLIISENIILFEYTSFVDNNGKKWEFGQNFFQEYCRITCNIKSLNLGLKNFSKHSKIFESRNLDFF